MSDKLEKLIEDHARLANENRILHTEIERLNQIIAETTETLKGVIDET